MGGNTLDNTKPFQKSTVWSDKVLVICYGLASMCQAFEDEGHEEDAKKLGELALEIATEMEKVEDVLGDRTMIDAAIGAGEAVLKELRWIKND